MTADPRLTRRVLVDVVIHVSAIVCLEPRSSAAPGTVSPSVRTHRRRARAAARTTPSHPIRSPRRRGTWLVAP